MVESGKMQRMMTRKASRTAKSGCRCRQPVGATDLARSNVHRDFKTETHIAGLGGSPLHGEISSVGGESAALPQHHNRYASAAPRCKPIIGETANRRVGETANRSS
jgi:hypothetical protein